MSLAIADPVVAGPSVVRDEQPGGITRRGFALSAALHVVLGGLLIIGLPRLFDPPDPQEMPVAVQLVTIAPETRATRPNPNPRPDAKPETPDTEVPVAKPEPKPEPPKPAPVPPSSAESPPPPEPKPAPPKPAPVPPQTAAAPPPPEQTKPPEPKPPPPPLPKPAEIKTEPKRVEQPPKPKVKPEAATQIAKSEPKAEQKKYDPGQFEALLKNLAPQQSAPSPDAPPQKPRLASARASSQPRAPLGGQLTASELDLIRQQIARCWNVPAGAREARDLVVEIKVAVDRDGTVQQATIIDQGRFGSDPFFRAAAESARRAFFNPMCRPLRLPPEKYAIWKDLVVDFSPKDIL